MALDLKWIEAQVRKTKAAQKIESNFSAIIRCSEKSGLRNNYSNRYEYYRSAAWEEKRQAALIRAGYKCEHCGITKWPLQAHHKTYGNLYKERPEDLEILCVECHKNADRARKKRAAYQTYRSRNYGYGIKSTWEDFENWYYSREGY